MRLRIVVLVAAAARAAGTTGTFAGASPTVLTEAQRALDSSLAPRIEAFVDAFQNYAPVPLKSGKLVFLSTRSGLPALYVGDAKDPSGAPRAIAAMGERVRAFTALPDERTILFLSDVKSDEKFSVFRVGVDGSGLRNLTPDAKMHRNPPRVARGRPGLFAYSAHRTEGRTVHVFVQTVDGAPARDVYADPQGGSVLDLSPDGAKVLFSHFVSRNEQVLFLIDAKTGNAARVFPGEGTTRISGAAFSADGSGIFVASARGEQPARLALLDAATLGERARHDETSIPTGEIRDLEVSPRGDRVAFVVDAGNRSEVRIADARTLAPGPAPKLGLGTALQLRFRADGSALTLSFFSPDAPGDVFSVDAKTGEVAPLRADARPGLAGLQKPVARIELLRAFDGLTIPVNVYLPPGAGNARLPTLVHIHGGPSSSAPIRWTPTAAFFAAMGFAVLEPNIRGSTGFGIAFEKADDKEKRGDAVRDVETVNRWARTQPWCDGERMAIGGISYGGYMTLLALTRQPGLWRAGIDGSGMSDLRTMEKLEDQTIRAYDETEFGAIGRDDAVLLEYSPLKDVAKIVAPVFVYQGVRDPVTPQNEADQIVAALRKGKIPVEYMLIENEGHGLTRRENLVAYLARSYRFLAEHMDLPRPR